MCVCNQHDKSGDCKTYMATLEAGLVELLNQSSGVSVSIAEVAVVLQLSTLGDDLAVNDEGNLVVGSALIELELDAVTLGLQEVRQIHDSGGVTVGVASVNVDGVLDSDHRLVTGRLGDLLVAVGVEVSGAGHSLVLAN